MAESNTAALSIQSFHCQSLCPLVLDRSNCQHLDGQSATKEIFSEIDWAYFVDDPDVLESSVAGFDISGDAAILISQDISMVDALNLEADLEINPESSKHDLIKGDISATRYEDDGDAIVSQGTENETSRTSEPMTMQPESSMIASKVAVTQAQVDIIVLSSDDEVDTDGALTMTFGLPLQPTYDRLPSSRHRKTIKRHGFLPWKEANKLLRQRRHSTPAKLRKVKVSSRSSHLVKLEEDSRSAGLALEVDHWHIPWLRGCYESLRSVIKTFRDLEGSKTMSLGYHGLVQTLFSKFLIIRGHIQEGKASNYTSKCNQGSDLQFFNDSIMTEALRQCSVRSIREACQWRQGYTVRLGDEASA